MPSHRMRFAVVAAALGAALVAGCGNQVGGSQQPVTGSPDTAGQAQAVEPAEITIPKIGARSSLIGLGIGDDGAVEVPPVTQPMQAGWFAGGPKPGEPGPAVILGHVNGGGHPGIFARLRELVPGDEVLIGRTDGGTTRFVIREVVQVPKSDFPVEAVYGDTAGPELRLITCGGTFDRTAHSYRDNVIAYADRSADQHDLRGP